jgi:hypothetical protein
MPCSVAKYPARIDLASAGAVSVPTSTDWAGINYPQDGEPTPIELYPGDRKNYLRILCARL